MKRKMTAIVGCTMLAITSATLPASVAVVNTNGQYLTVARNQPRQVILKPQPEGMMVAIYCRRGRSGC